MARAGDIIYLARLRGHVSQTDLARRSGVAQGMISKYERHQVMPSYEVVEHLVACCRFRLRVRLDLLDELQLDPEIWPLDVQRVLPYLKKAAAECGVRNLWLAPPDEKDGPYRFVAWSSTGTSLWKSDAVAEFERFLSSDGGTSFEILDAERLPPSRWRPAVRQAFPVILSPSWFITQTRSEDMPLVEDLRWYGTLIPDLAHNELLGRRRTEYIDNRPRRRLWEPRYRRAPGIWKL